MEVKLPDLIGNYDISTDRPGHRVHREVSLPMRQGGNVLKVYFFENFISIMVNT